MTKAKPEQPIEARTTANYLYLSQQSGAGPSSSQQNILLRVSYRPVCQEFRSALLLNVYGSRRFDGRWAIAEIAIQRAGLQEADVKELSSLTFYLSPDGYPTPQQKAIPQPVAMWLFGNQRTLVACLEDTRRRPLVSWMERARREEPDPHLHNVVYRMRNDKRSVILGKKKQRSIWPNLKPDEPSKSHFLFRYPASLKAPIRKPVPVGSLLSAGRLSGSSQKAQRQLDQTKHTKQFKIILPETSDLRTLGYRIQGTSRPERWRILMDQALPALGLKKVVATISGHRKRALSQTEGALRYSYALGEWEHDLQRLKTEVYPKYRWQFTWPS